MASSTTVDLEFIETTLIPEMVHNRCFCDPKSREFVELNSVQVSPSQIYAQHDHLGFHLYEATVVVEFSGEPRTFDVLVKLTPDDVEDVRYRAVLNEEILANKARLQYGEWFFPKYYAADMGKYGRPVVVVENLQANGYTRVLDREFNEEEADALVEFVGKFHGMGFWLKEVKSDVMREFYAKFLETTFDKEAEDKTLNRFFTLLNELKSISATGDKTRALTALKLKLLGGDNQAYYDRLAKHLGSNDHHEASSLTICQGLLVRENVWFKKDDEGKMLVRALDWQRVRYASNAVDLVTVLLQCEAEQWPKLIVEYVAMVQKVRPEMSGEELCMGMNFPGLPYALLVLAMGRDEMPEFDKWLKYFD